MTKGRSFFILTTARSGSTSLARILDEASNGGCVVEPVPNLNVETRLAMDGMLENPRQVLKDIIVPRVEVGLETQAVYGEKNLTYGPFIKDLHELLDCRFVYMKRDGRDVVRSMMDWHNRMFGTIYRECTDPGDLSPRALIAASNLPVHLDTSDYARPRPGKNDPWYERWESMSRLEMCSYYWVRMHDLFQSQLDQIPRESWIEIDYTHPQASDIDRVARFLGLEGLDENQIQLMLDSRINSLTDRTGEANNFPTFNSWTPTQQASFEAIAGPVMQRLGYARVPADRMVANA